MHNQDAIEAFRKIFEDDAQVVASAPGRVNLIGEHIDYNGGSVMPFAIPQRVYVAACTDESEHVFAHSAALAKDGRFPLDVASPTEPRGWENYVQGMVHELRAVGVQLPGAKLWIGGDLHPGCGLSSSAALCMAIGYALAKLAGVDVAPVKMALAGQAAEHKFAGTPCGIMDQYISCHGKADHALLIDCNKLTHEYVPFHADGVCVLAIPSGVKHALSSGAYEARVRACQRAMAVITQAYPEITSLHQVSREQLEACRTQLDDESYLRARHAVTEVARVADAVAALKAGEFERMGTLLWQTQDSLRDDYEVSCPEIDELIGVLRACGPVLGARMIGGGFGGVVIALVPTDRADEVEDEVKTRYYSPNNLDEQMFRVVPSAGAGADAV
ncbi:MAG: galactokinase [Phycisphaerales bacterium]|nr:galactokinase [Phycisphaerales bacterium]